MAVGACAALNDDDYITSTHRGHGHCLAKGGDPRRMMAELLGKATGYCKGKGGSMHIADPRLGILGANGIVGAGLPIATGAGLSAKLRKSGQVAVCFFGDGAVGELWMSESSSNNITPSLFTRHLEELEELQSGGTAGQDDANGTALTDFRCRDVPRNDL